MISAINFYRMRGSLAAGEYPLFADGADLSSYLIQSFDKVKYRDGLQAAAEVPYFDDMDTVNVAELGGRYYWVTAYSEKTNQNGQYIFTLDFMGPTSLYRSGDSINGMWKRTPTQSCKWLQDQITNGPMVIESQTRLTALDCLESRSTETTYWLQVTGHDNSGNIKQFGGFVLYDPDDESFDWLNGVYAADSSPVSYVPFGEWMSNIYTYTGMTDADIDDMSVSRRCPFNHRRTLLTGSVNLYYLQLLDNADSPCTQTIVNGYRLYDLTANKLSGAPPAPNTATVSIPLTDTIKRLGRFSVRDWNRNTIMHIETSRFSDLSTMTVTARMHSDLNGIYCMLTAGNETIVIPEGKLPYYGDTADYYAAYAMDSDRLSMQYAIQTAHYNRETADNVTIGNTVSGVATNIMVGALNANPVSILSGVAGGVASGIASAYEASRAMDLSILQAERDYTLTQKRAIDQPSSGYNVAYGAMYAFLNEINPLEIALSMPKVDNSYITTWAENYGYPAEGNITVTAQTGYYQGKPIRNYGGMWQDRSDEVFMRGFKFVNP